MAACLRDKRGLAVTSQSEQAQKSPANPACSGMSRRVNRGLVILRDRIANHFAQPARCSSSQE
jgi:hypothetical protein